MHLLGGANNRVHRAGLYAQGATNAIRFFYESDRAFTFHAVTGVEGNKGFAEDACQAPDAFFATWRALIVIGFPAGDCFSIRATGRVSAFGALGLRQCVFKLIGKGVWHGESQKAVERRDYPRKAGRRQIKKPLLV
jgi:hypothetical protein